MPTVDADTHPIRDDALSRCQDLQEWALQPDFCTCGRKFRLLEKVMVDYKDVVGSTHTVNQALPLFEVAPREGARMYGVGLGLRSD